MIVININRNLFNLFLENAIFRQCSSIYLCHFIYFSISGPASTVYAYLSELCNNKRRGRAIMGSSIIFGISCLFLPLLAWLVINQDWQFDIPFIGITYKPWRLFFIICSLPGIRIDRFVFQLKPGIE